MNTHDENLTRDESRVAELIGTLKHVEAPGNFDARVRARIAQRRDEKPRRSMLPIFAGVVTLALLAFVGYLGLRSSGTPTTSRPSEVANTQVSAPAAGNSMQPAAAPSPNAPSSNGQTVAATTQSKDKKPSNNAPQGGSIDEASKDDRKLTGRTFDTTQRRGTDTSVGSGQIPVSMVVEAVGVHASWIGSGWRVDNVRPNSVAERGGVRTGDIIESMDGKSVGEKTTFNDSVVGKSLRVRREGATVEIPFKP